MLLLLAYLAIVPVLAEDSDSWNTLMKNGSGDGFMKPVTQKEFDSALDQVEKIKKGKNKKKSPNKMGDVLSTEKPDITRDNPVIRIYNDAFNSDTIVKVGYYHMKPSIEDQNYFIVLTQGGKTAAKIKATKVRHSSFCKDEIKCVKIESIENTYLKFFYKDLDLALVGYLHILQPEEAAQILTQPKQ